jgi:hypothetical protein
MTAAVNAVLLTRLSQSERRAHNTTVNARRCATNPGLGIALRKGDFRYVGGVTLSAGCYRPAGIRLRMSVAVVGWHAVDEDPAGRVLGPEGYDLSVGGGLAPAHGVVAVRELDHDYVSAEVSFAGVGRIAVTRNRP